MFYEIYFLILVPLSLFAIFGTEEQFIILGTKVYQFLYWVRQGWKVNLEKELKEERKLRQDIAFDFAEQEIIIEDMLKQEMGIEQEANIGIKPRVEKLIELCKQDRKENEKMKDILRHLLSYEKSYPTIKEFHVVGPKKKANNKVFYKIPECVIQRAKDFFNKI